MKLEMFQLSGDRNRFPCVPHIEERERGGRQHLLESGPHFNILTYAMGAY